MSHDTITVLTTGQILLPEDQRLDVLEPAATGAQAVATTLTGVPDVLVLDINIADPSADSVVRRISEWAPATRVLAVGDDDDRLFGTLLAGAAGAVTRSITPAELAGAVIATARGQSLLTSRAAGRIIHHLDQAPRRSADALTPPTLTGTEREVLERLAAGDPPDRIAAAHRVTSHLVNRHAAYAVTKLHRQARDATMVSAYAG